MIEVLEESNAKCFTDARELYKVLSELYGRILQVRSFEENRRNYDLFTLENHRMGRLDSLEMQRSYRGMALQFSGQLISIGLGTSVREKVPLSKSAIDLFQEDSNRWIPIHQGNLYEEMLKRTEHHD